MTRTGKKLTELERRVIAWTKIHDKCTEYTSVYMDQDRFPIGENRELRAALLKSKDRLLAAGKRLIAARSAK